MSWGQSKSLDRFSAGSVNRFTVVSHEQLPAPLPFSASLSPAEIESQFLSRAHNEPCLFVRFALSATERLFFWLEMPTRRRRRRHTLQLLISMGGERSGELEQTLIDIVQLDGQSKSRRTD